MKSIFHQFPLIEQIIWTRDATRENIRISTPGDARKKIQQSSVGNRFHSHVSDWTSAKWAKMSWFMTIIATQHFSLRPLIFWFFFLAILLLRCSNRRWPMGPGLYIRTHLFFLLNIIFFFNLIICKRETGVERPAVELLVVVSLLTKFNEQGYHSNGLSMLYLKSFFKKAIRLIINLI